MPGHQWKRTESGEVARSTYHAAARLWHRHRGPCCTVCEFIYCEDCYPEGQHRTCPGPAPHGMRWDWGGNGGTIPPIQPELHHISVWD